MYLDTIDIEPRDTKYKPPSYEKEYHIFEKRELNNERI